MVSIPASLLEQAKRGNVLLFVGERILRDTQEQIVVDQLTIELATRCGAEQPEAYSFPEAAQAYVDEVGRHALVQFINDQYEALGDEPQPVHHMIAGLTDCKILATTCIDKRLERAFAEAGRPLNVVIGNKDVPFIDERKTHLYKLRGSLDRVESLVLTEGDYETFFEDQASISVVLQGYLARKTIVFVGYALSDPHFQDLYRKVTAQLDEYVPRSYAFGEIPNSRVARWCKRHGIDVVETRTTTFIESLAEQLARPAQPEPASQSVERPDQAASTSLPERPYKLLDYYEAGDREIFCGREAETQKLTALIHAHRLVLLYGASGAGKTSLLLAGVLPRLAQAEPPYEMLYVRAREYPARLIRETVQRRLAGVALPQNGSLIDLLAAATKSLERTLVIVLDQFEEFFIRWGAAARQRFIADLGELYDARDVPVKLVLSLREDWLAALGEIEPRIPEVYRTKLRLLPLSAAQARQAITAPLQPLDMIYEPALLDKLMVDLVDEQTPTEADRNSTTIMPPQLQLVCDALYDRARSRGSKIITLADYKAVGQAEGILGRYIEGALREHAGQDRALARAILMALVTPQETKAGRDLQSIAARVRADEASTERVLTRLTGQRLVRRLDEEPTYELAHDILAATIAPWIREVALNLRAREKLRRDSARIGRVTLAGALGGAIGFGLGLTPPIILHQAALFGGRWQVIDLVFIVPLLAFYGLLAGSGLALGQSVGQSLLSERPKVGAIVGGSLLGGLGFIAALVPLGIVGERGLLYGLLVSLGSGLFGALTGLGLTVPAALSRRQAFVLVGGAIGAALGIVILGALGFVPFQLAPDPTVPLPLLLVSGGLTGLILASSLAWAEARWPVDERETLGAIQTRPR